MSEIETYEHEGVPVRILWDEYCMEGANPRDFTNVGTFVHWHRDYILGDREINGTERKLIDRGGLRALTRWLTLFGGATVVMPVGMIDHSGISVYAGGGAHWSDSAGWDSGTVGVIFDTPESREETGVPLDKIEEALREEIKQYDLYVTGQVYGYQVGERTVEDSCWGFLGLDAVKEAANESASELAADYKEMLRIETACRFASESFV